MSEDLNNIEASNKKWYVLQAYAGQEAQVKRTLEEWIKRNHLENKFGDILVPTEEIVEIKSGRTGQEKRKSLRKFFPGYVLVQMDMDENLWHFVRTVPKVRGFVGSTADKPKHLTDQEAEEILSQVKSGDRPKPKVIFEPGEVVRVTDGPFVDFNGTVEEVNYEKSRLRVGVLIFGRSTPVDLDFSQVEKG